MGNKSMNLNGNVKDSPQDFQFLFQKGRLLFDQDSAIDKRKNSKQITLRAGDTAVDGLGNARGESLDIRDGVRGWVADAVGICENRLRWL